MLQKNQGLKKTNRRSRLPPLSGTVVGSVLVASDSIAILGTGLVTYLALIRYSTAQDLYAATIIFLWLASIILMHFAGLYRFEVANRPLRYVPAIVVAIATACLFMLAAAFSIKVSETLSRLWFGTFTLATVVSVTGFRFGISYLFRGAIQHARVRRSIAVVGSGPQAERLLSTIDQVHHRPIEVTGIYSHKENLSSKSHPTTETPEEADLDSLALDARSGMIDDVVIALPWSQADEIMFVMSKLRELPVNVYLGSDLIGFRTQFSSPPSHFGSLPVFQLIGKPMSGWDAVIKAVEDYVLGTILLVLLSPLLALIALGVWLTSGRPVL